MEYLQSAKNFAKRNWKGNETKMVLSGAILISGIIVFGKYMKERKLRQQLKEFEEESASENKVILHMIPLLDFPAPHASPYITKMIAFLEYNKIPYKIDTTMPRHFHTQKWPWITYKNHHQPDTNLIIQWFKTQSNFDYIDIDKHLNQKQLAITIAFKTMIEDGLSLIMGYRRIYNIENRKMFLQSVLSPIMAAWKIKLLAVMMDRQMKHYLWNSGISRFNEDEIYKKGEDLIESIIITMGDNKFFFGDKLGTLDICIYGHFAAMYQFNSVL
eukprot:353121_1